MVALKIAVLVMMIGSSVAPLHRGDVNKAFERPQVSEAINFNVTPVEEVRPEINTDKTYEQCMREAFERIYEEINRMLDELVDGREEQF